MSVETEVKIEMDAREFEALPGRLAELGAEQTLARVAEKNELFDYSDRRMGRRSQILRLRERGPLKRITMKIKDREDVAFKVRTELESDVSDAAQVRAIFAELGLEVCFRYDKYREIWQLGEGESKVKISLDETPVGCFVEVEASPEGIAKTAALLDFDPQRFSTKSYVEIYRERAAGGRKTDDLSRDG